jgi:hypothetical protein
MSLFAAIVTVYDTVFAPFIALFARLFLSLNERRFSDNSPLKRCKWRTQWKVVMKLDMFYGLTTRIALLLSGCFCSIADSTR